MSVGRYQFRVLLLCFVAVVHCCASVKAEIEIKTFSRYRIDNFDNNNNGYVAEGNERARLNTVESRLVAREISDDYSKISNWRIDESPNRQYENSTIRNGLDYDDLHTFNIAFERFNTRSFFQSRGLRLEQVIRIQPKVDETIEIDAVPPRNYWEVCFGACYSQIDDRHGFDADGGILGRTYATTAIDSSNLGPYIGLHLNTEKDGWQYGIGGSLQFAINATDSDQTGAIGEDLFPGSANPPNFVQPHNITYSESDNTQSLSGELRAQASRALNQYATFNVGYSSFYFGNIRYASESINWYVPNLGLVDNGTQDLFVGTAYANIEFRR